MGPTASGKTALAMALARRFPVELISVDSAQVFRDMNIGTAKPDAATLAEFPHQLIDVIAPTEAYSAARFRADALAAMAEISARGRVPLLVGGTMLYFKALLEGLAELPQADPATRAAIDREAARRGWPALHAELAEIDPATAARLHSTDAQRIQRALEVFRLSGRPLSALLAAGEKQTAAYRVHRHRSAAVRPCRPAPAHRRTLCRDASRRPRSGSGHVARALPTSRGAAVNALCRLSAGMGSPGGPASTPRAARPRHLCHPPAGQAPDHLAQEHPAPARSSTASRPTPTSASPGCSAAFCAEWACGRVGCNVNSTRFVAMPTAAQPSSPNESGCSVWRRRRLRLTPRCAPPRCSPSAAGHREPHCRFP
jgi:hypothetical protein